MGIDYVINPVLMGGLVKEVSEDFVKVHLHGRLGVIVVPHRLIRGSELAGPGTELSFYFSYIQVVEQPLDYDAAALDPALPMTPCLLGGTIIEVNDTAAKVELMDGLGTVAVPRRWLFTDVPLQEGLHAELWLSSMSVVGKREIPVRSI